MVRGAIARLVLSRMVVSGVSSTTGFTAGGGAHIRGGRVDRSAAGSLNKSDDIIEGESWDEK